MSAALGCPPTAAVAVFGLSLGMEAALGDDDEVCANAADAANSVTITGASMREVFIARFFSPRAVTSSSSKGRTLSMKEVVAITSLRLWPEPSGSIPRAKLSSPPLAQAVAPRHPYNFW